MRQLLSSSTIIYKVVVLFLTTYCHAVIVADNIKNNNNNNENENNMLTHDICLTDAQCLNGGKCIIFHPGEMKSKGITENSYYNYCNCHDGFGGQRCENFCPLSCNNGGICYKKDDNNNNNNNNNKIVAAADPKYKYSLMYSCKCYGHYTGTVCEIPYVNCIDGTQCFNGGKCNKNNNSKDNNNVCICPDTHTGEFCLDVNNDNIEQNKPFQFWITNLWNEIKDNEHIKVIAAVMMIIIIGIISSIIIYWCIRRRRNQNKQNNIDYSQIDKFDKLFEFELQESNRGSSNNNNNNNQTTTSHRFRLIV